MSQFVLAAEPDPYDVSDSVLAAGQPLDADAAIKLNHNAKFGIVRPEVFYAGFFRDGDTVPLPTSPVDGYVYSLDEVQFKSILASTLPPGAGFASGQTAMPATGTSSAPVKGYTLRHFISDVDDLTGTVTIITSYYRPDGSEIVTHDGFAKVWILGQRKDLTDTGGVPPELEQSALAIPPWGPAFQSPVGSETFADWSEKHFPVSQSSQDNADGSVDQVVTVKSYAPLNQISELAAPTVPLTGTSASIGGQLPAGLYYARLVAWDGSKYGKASLPVLINVPAGTSTNKITISGLSWPAGTAGWGLWMGTEPHELWLQGGYISPSLTGPNLTVVSGSNATPTAIAIGGDSGLYATALLTRALALPDDRLQFIRLKAKNVVHGGIWGSSVISFDATHITVDTQGNPMTVNQYAGRYVKVVARKDDHSVETEDFLIAANDADGVLTMAGGQPLPGAEGFGGMTAGWVLVCLAQATGVGTDANGNYIEDTLFDNSFSPGGMSGGAEAGNLLRIIEGAGKGYAYKITANTGTRINIAGDWVVTPDTTSVFIVEQDGWPYVMDATVSPNPAQFTLFTAQMNVRNLADSLLLLIGVTVDDGGLESPEFEAPYRMIWIYGQGAAAAAASTYEILIADPLTIDPANGAVQRLTLTQDVLESHLLDAADGADLEIEIKQDGIGGRQFNWPPEITGSGQFAIGPGQPNGVAGALTAAVLRSAGPGEWRARSVLTT